MTEKIVGMNIDAYIEKYRTTHNRMWIVYVKSSGRIIYFGASKEEAIKKSNRKAVCGILSPLKGVKLPKLSEINPKHLFPAAWE